MPTRPLVWADAGLTDEIMTKVVEPTLAEMRRRGTPFNGLLYAGLALTSKGLRVVEFNVRFGDPETQAVLSLLKTPLAGVLDAAARGELDTVGPRMARRRGGGRGRGSRGVSRYPHDRDAHRTAR